MSVLYALFHHRWICRSSCPHNFDMLHLYTYVMYLYFFKCVICCALHHHKIFRSNCPYCFYRFWLHTWVCSHTHIQLYMLYIRITVCQLRTHIELYAYSCTVDILIYTVVILKYSLYAYSYTVVILIYSYSCTVVCILICSCICCILV